LHGIGGADLQYDLGLAGTIRVSNCCKLLAQGELR